MLYIVYFIFRGLLVKTIFIVLISVVVSILATCMGAGILSRT